MPAPGLDEGAEHPGHQRPRAIENPIIHLKVRKAIRPVPVPDIDPVATMTDAITSGTIDI